MTTPQKRHRERAACMIVGNDYCRETRASWIDTGAMPGMTHYDYEGLAMATGIAELLADTEAETRAEENQLRRQKLGIIAIPLPECSVAHNRLVRAGTSERLLRGTEDLERGILSGRHGTRFRPTLLLEPVEDDRSGG